MAYVLEQPTGFCSYFYTGAGFDALIKSTPNGTKLLLKHDRLRSKSNVAGSDLLHRSFHLHIAKETAPSAR
jgi:hypothetical protein